MRRLIAFFILCLVKAFSHLFYRGEFKWITDHPENPWSHVRMIVLLNHTSLFEPIYIQVFSLRYLWYLTKYVNIPGADITLNRPFVGLFWRLMVPNISAISRKKDETWFRYLKTIKKHQVIVIAPEGRMKRPNGLDKFGKPMTVKGGIADIIEDLHEGGILLALSGGLHHVQRPGQAIPHLFKTIKMNFAYLDIPQYKAKFPGNRRERKIAIIKDLQKRLQRDCPQIDEE